MRRPTFHEAIANGLSAGYAADDGVGLHFVGRELVGAVSSRPQAKAYRVALGDGGVVEEEVVTRFLGD
jgi:dipeptidase E